MAARVLPLFPFPRLKLTRQFKVKLEPRDYIALVGAIVTVSTVLWRGGQITSDVASTKEAVQAMAPVVTRLDSATARLDATVEANKVRLTDLTRRVETLEQRR